MQRELLYGISEWVLFLGLLALLLAAFEIGYRLGRSSRIVMAEPASSQITTLQSAILGILGLLLGFTFSMSVARFDARKQLVLDEANAIGTAFLRSKLLASPRREQMAALFREYTDLRLGFYAARVDQRKLEDAIAEAGRLQQRLWSIASAAAEEDRRAVTTGLLLQAVNDVIDLHEKRLTAFENHVPEPILLLLSVVAAIGMAMTGVSCATSQRRYFVLALIVAFLITFTIVIIVDLDRPRRGLIRVSQGSMVRLQESLRDPRP